MPSGSPASASASPPGGPQPGSGIDLAVIILNYNTCGLLRDCLRTVVDAQRAAAAQGVAAAVCVVDNASTDGSAAMVRSEFANVHVIANSTNAGYSAGNNQGLRWFGYGDAGRAPSSLPRYALLLNPDTLVPAQTLRAMVDFMDAHPAAGAAGPRVRRPDGTLDRACRRSFPTPRVSLYRLTGLSRLFPNSPRFNAYNLEYLAEDAVHRVDSVVGAFMLVRREAIQAVGLLDESFFMYGEDLDWAKRISDAGWEVWYNGRSEITHVKEAASRQSAKSRVDFYEAMWIFYCKHYRSETAGWLDRLIRLGIAARGGLDIARHLWRYSGSTSGSAHKGSPSPAQSPEQALAPGAATMSAPERGQLPLAPRALEPGREPVRTTQSRP